MDVQGMTDEEIRRSSTTLSMFHFVMKHIQQPGLFSVLTQILRDFRTALEGDRQDGYALFRLILTLVEARFNEDEREQLRALTEGDVSSEEGEDVMRTIAETYIEEGYQKGIEKGEHKRVCETALRMLQKGAPLDFISETTDLFLHPLLDLKKKSLSS